MNSEFDEMMVVAVVTIAAILFYVAVASSTATGVEVEVVVIIVAAAVVVVLGQLTTLNAHSRSHLGCCHYEAPPHAHGRSSRKRLQLDVLNPKT